MVKRNETVTITITLNYQLTPPVCHVVQIKSHSKRFQHNETKTRISCNGNAHRQFFVISCQAKRVAESNENRTGMHHTIVLMYTMRMTFKTLEVQGGETRSVAIKYAWLWTHNHTQTINV